MSGAPFELVIFDNDGVLVDSEGHAQFVTAALLTRCGLPMTPADCRANFLGRSQSDIRAWSERRLGRPLPAHFEADFHMELFARFRRALAPVPGVADVLDRLGNVCVASSSTHERIRVSLEATGLLARFGDRIFSAEDVSRGKPAPDLFVHAARACGAPPARCVVIEDSATGVDAANAAGMTVFGFARVTPAAELVHATGVFTSMRELPALLGRAPR